MTGSDMIASLTANASVWEIGKQAALHDQYDVVFLSLVWPAQAAKGSTTEDYYTEYLKSLLPFLKTEGRVLLVAENRYGIQNWCGKREVYTGIPFEGFADCQTKKTCRAFHRKELIDILEAAGLSAYRFYYPMPDYDNIVRVYTDTIQPRLSEAAILGYRYTKKDKASLLFRDTDVLKDIISNGAFPFFANFFVVEAARKQEHLLDESEKIISQFNRELERAVDNGQKGKAHMLEQGEEAKDMALQAQNRYLLAAKGYVDFVQKDYDQPLINQVMRIQLDLLKKLKQVCDAHGLRLFAIYGTLLGAARHGGVIPGDDDIDVALLREDYEKLLTLEAEFEDPYFLQTPWNDDCFFGGYLKLRNRNTTSIHPQNRWVECCEGIGIDIFPLDRGYKNRAKEKWKEKRICFYQRLLYAKAYGHSACFMDMPLLIWKSYKYLGKLFTRQQMADRLNMIMGRGDAGGKVPFGIFAHYTRGRGITALPQAAFEDAILLEYEDMCIDAPEGYEKILEKRYGKEYMRLPYGVEGKRRHGFYSADVSYQNYKRRFSGLLHLEPGNKGIVLFADDTVIEMYFKEYGGKYPPSCIVALEDGCLPEEVRGIQVIPFSSYQPEDKNTICPIVCSIYVRKMEHKMRLAGYREYYFFLGNRDWMLLENPMYALLELKRQKGEEINSVKDIVRQEGKY